jgi:hypothetical protein
VAPECPSLSTQIRLSIISMSLAAMVRPSPVPVWSKTATIRRQSKIDSLDEE